MPLRVLRPAHGVIILTAALTLCSTALAVTRPTTAAADPTQLSIAAAPALYPAFAPDVTDYVSRCDSAHPVQLSINAPAGTAVTVDHQSARDGSFDAVVRRDVGQEFAVDVAGPGSSTTYYVRCIPAAFPSWTVQRPGTPQAEWYEILPFPVSTHQYMAFV